MQLDAEEDGDVFYKPPVEPTARRSDERASGETESSTGTRTIAGDDDE